MDADHHSTMLAHLDMVSDLMHNWVGQRPDFKSALSLRAEKKDH